jgi:hypothetical protein
MNRVHMLIFATTSLLMLPFTGIAQQQDSVRILKDELQSLHRVFETLNAVDTLYIPFFPRWYVHDREIALRIQKSFTNHNIPFDENDPVCIIATLDQQDIADITIGKARFGRMYAKFVLARDLYHTILERKYEYTVEIPAGYK